MENNIDFVIVWVDGNDKKWREEKRKYDLSPKDDEVRYRDWDNLKYWFRGVEKFTPWVRKIHLVTWGHLPEWLNVHNTKLNIVNHKDFIPKQYLPTFSSQCIELNIHKIKDLAENFVYFNDDMFIIKKMKKEDFFKKDLPCDSAILNAQVNIRNCNSSVLTNNMEIINDNFDKDMQIKKNIFKYYNFKYGKNIIRTLMLSLWRNYTGFLEMHLPTSFNKNTFVDVWDKEYDMLNNTCLHKFRTKEDLNQWLMRDWQLASGNFIPRKFKIGKYLEISNNNNNIYNIIKNQKYKMICINDSEDIVDFKKEKQLINSAFDLILPSKSSFEIL